MDVTSLTNAGAGGLGSPGKSTLGKNDFLKLLLAQLSHQDPTSPADSQAFVAQLAQFANVEQLQGVNQQLETLLMAQAAGNQTQTVSLLGKEVRFKSDKVSFDGSNPASLAAELSQPAATVTAVITDAAGNPLRTLELRNVGAGPLSLTWDGLDSKGQRVAQGTYSVRLTAADGKGGNIPVEMRGAGRVTGISYAKGYAELTVGGVTLTLRDILSVNEAKEN